MKIWIGETKCSLKDIYFTFHNRCRYSRLEAMQKWITFIKCMPPLIVCCRCVDATYEFLPQLLRVCFLHSFLTEQWLLHRRDQHFLQICCTWKSFQLMEEIASKCGKFPTNMSAHALHNINSDHGENFANLAPDSFASLTGFSLPSAKNYWPKKVKINF